MEAFSSTKALHQPAGREVASSKLKNIKLHSASITSTLVVMRRFRKRFMSRGPSDGEGQPGPSTANSVLPSSSQDTSVSELAPSRPLSNWDPIEYRIISLEGADSEAALYLERLPGSLCSLCGPISVNCDIKHFSFERLKRSVDLGCPCCRLIYDRLDEMVTARAIIVGGQAMDEGPYGGIPATVQGQPLVLYDHPAKAETYHGRSKILFDGLSGIVYQSLDWPRHGQNTRIAFEFFRQRGMGCSSLAQPSILANIFRPAKSRD